MRVEKLFYFKINSKLKFNIFFFSFWSFFNIFIIILFIYLYIFCWWRKKMKRVFPLSVLVSEWIEWIQEWKFTDLPLLFPLLTSPLVASSGKVCEHKCTLTHTDVIRIMLDLCYSVRTPIHSGTIHKSVKEFRMYWATIPRQGKKLFYIRLHRKISSATTKIEKWNKNKLISFSFETSLSVFKRNFNDDDEDDWKPNM